MPSADAQRVWYPEMLEHLLEQWRDGLSFEDLIALRDALDAMLQQIRADRHIRPTGDTCPDCGHFAKDLTSHVSVRSMIVTVARSGLAPADPVYALEKRWANYRKQHGLDLNGKSLADAVGCTHG